MVYARWIRNAAALLLLCMSLFVAADASGIVQAAYTFVEDEGSSLPSRQTLNFVGAGVTATDSGGKTVVNIPGGGGGGGGNVNTFGAYPADLPGSPSAGDLFWPNNTPHVFGRIGSAWQAFDAGGVPLSTWTNSGTYSVFNAASGQPVLNVSGSDPVMALTGNTGISSDSVRGYDKAATLAVPYTYTVKMTIAPDGQGFLGSGIVIGDPTSGRRMIFMAFSSGDFIISRVSPTFANDGNQLAQAARYFGPSFWLRIENNGSQRIYSISPNGLDWVQVFTEAFNAYVADDTSSGVAFYMIGPTLRGLMRVESLSIN